MNVEEAAQCGLDEWAIARIRSWGIVAFTDVQAKALKAGVASGRSAIVSAPTSSGKTLVGELAVLAAARAQHRIVYLVPHKALADQKYLDFQARFGETSSEPLVMVGLSTGDREEGDVEARLLVATYEKALGLALTDQLDLENALIVCDELQIIGEKGRGPDIETLCAIFRRRGVRQFLALTATVQNPEDFAAWLSCDLIRSAVRDVPLHQEIWHSKRAYRTTFGQDEGAEVDIGVPSSCDVLGAVNHLLKLDRGPVLVFVESRNEAAKFAAAFGKSRQRMSGGIELAAQLDLFSEPTESSAQLRENAERRVAFHTASLSPQERQVIETGFTNSKFDVCFATSTLAAGVNFPFRSILFAKLTYQWGDRAGSQWLRSEYRNMSGRAGRLGMHPDGFAVLIPQNQVELSHAQRLVAPENDRLESQFVALSLRKTILGLVASRLAGSADEVIEFFKHSLYWYQTLERNPLKLTALQAKSHESIKWLLENGLLQPDGTGVLVTASGMATAMSGLLPATAVNFIATLRKFRELLETDFDGHIDGLIYAACACEEFRGERPTRFLQWPIQQSTESFTYWIGKKHISQLDRTDAKLAQCAHAVSLFAHGVAERKIAHATGIPSGSIHRLSLDVAWVLDGLHRFAAIPELGCSQALGNRIAMLSRRVRWGAPSEALDVIRVAEKHSVPGFGRQRAMALVENGISTVHDVLAATKGKLTELLRSDKRAQALMDAASSTVGITPNRLAASHKRIAEKLGVAEVVERCGQAIGIEYEKAINDLLSVESAWTITVIDDGVRQNVPDLLIRLNDLQLLLECKTCTKSPQLISKEEAWAVNQKAADFDSAMHRVALGKPAFDETCKKKAAAATDITLIEHATFMEGLLRVHAGTLSPRDFLQWLATPGFAELIRLGGKPTYATS